MASNGSERAAAPMTLERFCVQGFRSYADATLELEPGVTVLFGLNDVGKSSLLEAMHYYGVVSTQSFRVRFADAANGHESPGWRFEADWRDPESGLRYEHAIVFDTKAPSERLRWQGGECTWDPRERSLMRNAAAHDARGLKRFSSLGSVTTDDWRRDTDVPDEVTEQLGIVRRVSVPKPYLLQPSALAWDSPLSLDDVTQDGFGWAAMLQDLTNRRDGSLERLEQQIRGCFPFFRKVRVVEDRIEVTRTVTAGDDERPPDPAKGRERYIREFERRESRRGCEFLVAMRRPGDLLETEQWVAASATSSGLLLTLAYLTIAYTADEGSLVLLEEPENGLNEAVVLRMMRAFLDVVEERKLQVVMTTHNPYWLDLVPPEAVRVVTRDEEGSHVRSDPENLERIREEGYHLSEVVGLGGPEELLRRRGGG